MLTVNIPPGYDAERNYILKVLLTDFLGLPFTFKRSIVDKYYSIEVDNKILTIEDHFFSNHNEKVGYLNELNIPKNISHYSSHEFNADNLPVIYGLPNVKSSSKGINCQIDIFASAFFMFTRWEEYVVDHEDAHGRFPAKLSLAYRNNFLERPIINEYLILLQNMLLKLSSSIKFKNWQFQCIPTHDVDHLKKWSDITSIRKKLAHDFITKKRPLIGVKNILDLLKTKSGLKKDPYDTFKYIVELSKANGLVSRFYFMSGGCSSFDNNYDLKEAKSLIEFLKENDQVIGFHPSYSSFEDQTEWKEEKNKLEVMVGRPIKEGRQHYLRFKAPHTWISWNNAYMLTDSTIGYSEWPGFRSGICYPYPVFDFINKRVLALKENPLILMETTLITHMKLSPSNAFAIAKKLYFTVKKYKGNFTFLWHNNTLHTVEDSPYLPVYENIIKGFPEHE